MTTLNQAMKPDEYCFDNSFRTFIRAESSMYASIEEGEISAAERPRVVEYSNNAGSARYAVVLTDTFLSQYCA